MNTALYVLAALMILTGLAGVLLPVLPGMVLMFAGMLLVAWVGQFAVIGPWTLGLLAALTLASIAVDVLAGLVGAQRVGASRQALLGAAPMDARLTASGQAVELALPALPAPILPPLSTRITA